MAIISHPDKLSASLSDEEKESKKSEFLKIQEAYDILSDPRERMVYDAKLHGVRVFNNPDFIVPPVDIRTDPLAGSTLTTFIETSLFQMKMKITIPMAEIPHHRDSAHYLLTRPVHWCSSTEYHLFPSKVLSYLSRNG